MTAGSDDARTPDDERSAVDSAWDALVEGAQSDDDAAAEHSGSRSVSGGHSVVGKNRVAEPDEEMERLMFGAPPKLPSVDEVKVDVEVEAAKVDEAAKIDAAKIDAAKIDDAKLDDDANIDDAKIDDANVDAAKIDAATKADDDANIDDAPKAASPADRSTPRRAANEPRTVSAAKPAANRPPLRVIAEGGSPRAARPTETPAQPSSAAPESRTPWAWIGLGVVAVGAVAFLALPKDDAAKKPPAKGTTPTAAASDGADVAAPSPDVPRPADAEGTGGAAGSDGSSGSDDAPSTPTPRTGDPREVPPGTSPEAAAAFVRLPVTPYDRPPLGGIGATGIHVDAIEVSATFEDGECKGQATSFSVAKHEHVSVCVRVVHQREKEELQVLWQKHGGSTRRSKMVVQPRHAYRTRGYFKVRAEYIGDWTVRILSVDDVELARHDFTVVP